MSPKPSSSVCSADDRAWQIERYVLADPTLDRRDFETAMADDLELALAVAHSVAQLQGLAQACRGSNPPLNRSRSEARARQRRPRRFQGLLLATAALAAAWLVAFVPWQMLRPTPELTGFSQPTASLGAEQRLAEVAQQWIDLDTLADAELAELETHASASMPEEHDWMLQVSAAFFEESES